VVGALVLQVSLGAVYIWSVFQTPLKDYFKWPEASVTLPAQIVLACFALAVIFGGRLQDKFGPRVIATIGGVVLGAGLILARFSQSFAPGLALVWLIATFSVLGGIGIGMGYVCPIATCVKWFPDKRGLITGLAVAGFGAGAFFFAPLAKGLVSVGKYQLLGATLFGLPKIGVFNTFMTLGIVFLVLVVAGAQLLRNPPAGYVPKGWTPPQKAAVTGPAKQDFGPGDVLKTPQFWLLWLTYLAGCTAGLQVIMKASPIWESIKVGATASGAVNADLIKTVGAAGAMAVSILAIFNSLGRIAWGKISDSIGRKTTLVVMFVICGVAMLLLNVLRTYPLYLVGICVVGLCFGGFLALYPAVTADYYGSKHYGVNYGLMFSAYGVGGIVGPMLAAALMKTVSKLDYKAVDAAGNEIQKTFAVGNYQSAFMVAGAMCLAAAVLTFFVRPPKAKES
jgi:OFA family oxalate/formate antiporter-like MFS transporter